MADDDRVNAETGLQIKLAQRLMIEQTLEVANRMVASMEELYAQFPSDEVGEALRNTIGWRDGLRIWLRRDSAVPNVCRDKPST